MKLASILRIATLSMSLLFVGSLNGVVTSPALSQESFTNEHLASAAAAIKATRSAEGFDEILPVVADDTKTLLMQSNPEFAREIDVMVTEVAIDLAVRRPDLDRTIQEVWARRFTKEELDEITKFYTTPVGAKLAEKSPELGSLAIGAAREWREKIGEEMLNASRKRLEAVAAPDPNAKPAEQ